MASLLLEFLLDTLELASKITQSFMQSILVWQILAAIVKSIVFALIFLVCVHFNTHN